MVLFIPFDRYVELHGNIVKSGVCFSQLMLFQVPSTGEEESLLVVQSYDDLSRKLWQLEGLPLSITAVQGAHPALRYTQVISHLLKL